MSLSEALKSMSNHIPGAIVLEGEEFKRLHDRLLEVLIDFKTICEENNIHWGLGAGNLLGAVRNGGFIPWDDDIDINMEREEFEKLVECFPGRFSDKYILRKPGDKGYLYHFPRIYIKGTKFREIVSMDDGNNELFMDIFLADAIPDSAFKRKLHGTYCTVLLGLNVSRRVYHCRKQLYQYCENEPAAKKEIKKRARIGRLIAMISMEKCNRMTDRAFCKYKNPKSKQISFMSGAKHYFGEIFDREKMCHYTMIPFEGIDVMVPSDPDYYLRGRYGADYMTPPSIDEIPHRVLMEYEI